MTTGKFLGLTGALSLLCMTALYAGQAKPAAPAVQKPAAAATQATPESITSGAALYKRYCVMCHGASGAGDGPAAKTLKGKLPSLADKAIMSKHTDAQLVELITDGQKTEIGNMPPMGKKMTPEQITDVVNFVRTLAK
jgi:mono/diheme cytochrome c family protein